MDSQDAIWLGEYQIPNGPLVKFRHVTPNDAEAIADSIRTASPETLLHRFFSPIRSVSLSWLRELLIIDQPASLCVIGLIAESPRPRIICGVRFVRESGTDPKAEFAITVHDEFQHQGLGTFLMRMLGDLAWHADIDTLEGFVLNSNTAMRRLATKVSPSAPFRYEQDVVRVLIPTETLVGRPEEKLFRWPGLN